MVEGENPFDFLALGNADQRCICEIHRQVSILVHQRLHSWRIVPIERRQAKHLGFDHFPQGALRLPGKIQQIHGLGERRPNGEKGIVDGVQRLHPFGMVRLVSIEQGGLQSLCWWEAVVERLVT